MKKAVSVAVCVLLVLQMFVMIVLPAGAVTQNEAVAWLRSQDYAQYDLDGNWGYQCSDFVSAYMNWLCTGNPRSGTYGVYNANYYPTVAGWNTSRWQVIENYYDFLPQPGDIFVTAGNSSYGHVGVVLSSTITNATVIDQNAINSSLNYGSPARIHNITWSGSYAPRYYIRFKGFTTECSSHTKGTYMYYWAAHPHYNCWKCSNCGVVFEDRNSTTYLASCSICNPPKKNADVVFKDIKKSAWYYDAVNYTYKNDLFSGTSSTRFSPNGKMTRAMFVTVLGRLDGVSVNNNVSTKFRDVKSGKYYTGYVSWATSKGIVYGTTATRFSPNSNVTREQICALLVRYCGYKGISLRTIKSAVNFKDNAKISDYALSAVRACQRAGLISGEKVSGGYKFRPRSGATRAEVASIIMNFDKLY